MKKSIVFIVFLMFITMAVFPSGESAGVTITLTDWEDCIVGATSGSSGIIDFVCTGTSETKITLDNPHGGAFCMKHDSSGYGNKHGEINISLQNPITYVSKISFWFYGIRSSSYNDWGGFQFEVKNSSGTVLKLRCAESSRLVRYYDIASGYQDFFTMSSADAFYHIEISHNLSNLMIYSVYNESGGLINRVNGASSFSGVWTSFSYIYITSVITTPSGHHGYEYYDDFKISTEREISSDECEYRYMTERYSYIGTVNSYCEHGIDSATIEVRYNIPTTQNITCIDLAVGTDQYNDDPVKANYELTMNGIGMGSPDCFIEYSYYYILRWIIDVELTNDIVIMEFTHSEKTYFGRYWTPVTGCNSNTDLDGDGEIRFLVSNEPDGEYNGQYVLCDIAYQMYYEDIQFPDDEDYYDNDYIWELNETHYCGEPVWLTYLLTTMASDTYVRIWNDDTTVEINDVMFPYKCPTTTETIGFIAEVKANYTAKLYRNSIELDNCSFYVEDFRNPTNYVYTMPNPCFEGEPYTVKYAFDNADSYDGAIFLSSTPDYRNYYDIYYLLDGESGSYTQIQNTPCTIYYILTVNKNGTYHIVNNGIHLHTVKSKSLQNYFTLGASHLTLTDGDAMQLVSGETTHIGGNCKIYDNGKLVYTITETPFNEFYTINTAGNHKVEMRLVTNETIILHTQNYTVSGEEDAPPPEEDIGEVIRDYIKQEWGDLGLLAFAFGIIIGLMLIPLYVQLKASQTNTSIEIPWLVYVLFAIVGVIVDVYLGFLPVYVILLMCIGGIACAVAMYYNNN